MSLQLEVQVREPEIELTGLVDLSGEGKKSKLCGFGLKQIVVPLTRGRNRFREDI